MGRGNPYTAFTTSKHASATITDLKPGFRATLGSGTQRYLCQHRPMRSAIGASRGMYADKATVTGHFDSGCELYAEGVMVCTVNIGQQADQYTGLFLGEMAGIGAPEGTVTLGTPDIGPMIMFGAAHDYEHEFSLRYWGASGPGAEVRIPTNQGKYATPRTGNGRGVYGMTDVLARRIAVRYIGASNRAVCWVDGEIVLDHQLPDGFAAPLTILTTTYGGFYATNGVGTTGMTASVEWDTGGTEIRPSSPSDVANCKRVKVGTAMAGICVPNTGLGAATAQYINRETGIITLNTATSGDPGGPSTMTVDATCSTTMEVYDLDVDVVIHGVRL